ncbi:carnosine N-methyltransferase-like [Oscarella lobularis]|uniref:carnosine N-methyltransferase-like n=1 Tax=Oscarella lobularis TaxID=121494 RepID=UPI003313C52A
MDDDEEKEKEHFQRVCNSFAYYRIHTLKRVARAHQNYSLLPSSHQKILHDFLPHLERIKEAADANYRFILQLLVASRGMFVNSGMTDDVVPPIDPVTGRVIDESVPLASGVDMDKVTTTVKQFYRDWSIEGEAEREICYHPIIEELQMRLPLSSERPVSVLVPGSGLGRLAFEIAKLGYQCQGNEWSMFMLTASHFMLNHVKGTNVYTIHPWLHHFCNNLANEDQLQTVRIPDVDPHSMPKGSHFSMAAGSFTEVYTEPNVWDCVATCYFIDTAANVLDYVETISNILKPGGYWINFGPLLYHFADMPNEKSVELSYETIKRAMLTHYGFQLIKEVTNVPSTYIQSPKSMMKMTYNCVFFVVQKPFHAS